MKAHKGQKEGGGGGGFSLFPAWLSGLALQQWIRSGLVSKKELEKKM
jgi:hypothetical protein